MNNASHYFFTSESVTEGHPDKIADQISDAILDAMIRNDQDSKVACETLVTTGMCMVAGEITTKTWVDIPEIVRDTICRIGYSDPFIGFDGNTCAVMTCIDKQSVDISRGIDPKTSLFGEQGAGDQGIVFGYACDETEELMPMSISYAHKIAKYLTRVRKSGKLPFLRPDGKTQVTIEYENNKPRRVEAVVLAAQHVPNIENVILKEAIMEEVLKKVIPENMTDNNTKYFINTTGRFVLGGPQADCGITGRKIIVDTYGGHGHHGGGCFSGKDPSKVDRSASYFARYVAKNLVASGVASKVELQVAYAIGVSDPVSVLIRTYGTSIIPISEISLAVKKLFDFRPEAIITKLNLKRPIYRATASYGHFGREEEFFTWEKKDMVDALRKELKL